MDLREIFHQLKRRNVFKVAGVYAVAGWVLIQVAATTFPFFGVPDWGVRFVIGLVLLGFPIALILAWAFEMTPDGVKRTEEVPQEYSITHNTGRKLNNLFIGLLALAVLVLSYKVFLGNQAKPVAETESEPLVTDSLAIPSKSVAVLPFKNLSTDSSNAYFAAGMRDEILTQLYNIGDLKVIARNSSNQYPSHPGDLHKVALQLKVATVLEGSVQKAGNEVLINLQLINTRTNNHIWADSYQRSLKNVFDVEGEVAKKVASALQAKLTAPEVKRLTVSLTTNAEAYDTYLHGRVYEEQSRYSPGDLKNAVAAYRKVTEIDPGFALAWARLAIAETTTYWYYDHTPERLAAARDAVNKILTLAPDSGITQLALGDYYYHGLRDYKRAHIAYEEALRNLPNSSEALLGIAFVDRRQGNWTQSLAHFQQAVARDPLNSQLLYEYASTYTSLRRFNTALDLLNHALTIHPKDPTIICMKATVYQAKGDLNHAEQVLSGAHISPKDPYNYIVLVQQKLFRHNFSGAIRLLHSALNQKVPSFPLAHAIYFEKLGFAEQMEDHDSNSKQAFLQALTILQKAAITEPNNPDVYVFLGLIKAQMGLKIEALAAGKKAVKLLPASKDAYSGPGYEEMLAQIETLVGDYDPAINTLQRLLAVPYANQYARPVTIASMRINPVWNSLRSIPRFQALLHDQEQENSE